MVLHDLPYPSLPPSQTPAPLQPQGLPTCTLTLECIPSWVVVGLSPSSYISSSDFFLNIGSLYCTQAGLELTVYPMLSSDFRFSCPSLCVKITGVPPCLAVSIHCCIPSPPATDQDLTCTGLPRQGLGCPEDGFVTSGSVGTEGRPQTHKGAGKRTDTQIGCS